jgi:hypothetical protein
MVDAGYGADDATEGSRVKIQGSGFQVKIKANCPSLSLLFLVSVDSTRTKKPQPGWWWWCRVFLTAPKVAAILRLSVKFRNVMLTYPRREGPSRGATARTRLYITRTTTIPNVIGICVGNCRKSVPESEPEPDPATNKGTYV